MAAWNDAWFAGRTMPPNDFPNDLLNAAQSIAED